MLPTGSGKTLVAVLLVNHYANEIISSRADGPGADSASGSPSPPLPLGAQTRRRRLAVFLCPTKALVAQQAALLHASTPLRVRALTGDDRVDIWNEDTWGALLEATELLAATPDVVLNALSAGFMQARALTRLTPAVASSLNWVRG